MDEEEAGQRRRGQAREGEAAKWLISDLAEFPDGSAVGFVAGVLEHAPNPEEILTELRRIAGEHLFFGARLQSWTLSAAVLHAELEPRRT